MTSVDLPKHPTASDIWALDRRRLRALMERGHAIDPASLAGWAYRGTSLGLPRIVERATWKTFQKAFVHDGDTGLVRGWNVRLVQSGPGSRSEPRRDRSRTPLTFGHFDVVPAPDRGLVLDYRARNRGFLARARDPIVAVRDGDADLLLGTMVLALAGAIVPTPSFFTLEREHRVDHVPA